MVGTAIGAPRLVQQLERYAELDGAPERLIALAATPAELASALDAAQPARVLTVTAGALAPVLRPLQAQPCALPADLPEAAWRARGFRPAHTRGVQGPGALAWAVAERIARRFGRPELADRARFAMQRALPASRWSGRLAALSVREYRSVT